MMVRGEWPADLRWLLDEFKQTEEGRKHGDYAPRWFVAANGGLVRTGAGLRAWREVILPAVTKLVGA